MCACVVLTKKMILITNSNPMAHDHDRDHIMCLWKSIETSEH